jgi:hypothetical protein
MAANYIGTAFDSGRLNGGFSKSYNSLSYMDFSRFENIKKINIDYTLYTNNQPLVSAPVFKASKITPGYNNTAYLDNQVDYKPNSMINSPVNKEYNKIR